MSGRLRLGLAAALIGLMGVAGCADDVSPAITIGDTKIGNSALLDEVDEWAASPTLLAGLQLPSLDGSTPGSYSQQFVGFVAANRVAFELHRQQFEELGLELTDADRETVRTDIFGDPQATAAVFEELSPEYGDRLVEDLAKQFAVSDAMGTDYQAWAVEAFADESIEVNPRYGSWDGTSGQVRPPSGPAQPFTTPGL